MPPLYFKRADKEGNKGASSPKDRLDGQVLCLWTQRSTPRETDTHPKRREYLSLNSSLKGQERPIKNPSTSKKAQCRTSCEPPFFLKQKPKKESSKLHKPKTKFQKVTQNDQFLSV
jgi:hypothetical protein